MADLGDLSYNQRNALRAMLHTSRMQDAAAECGLTRQTLWKYLQDDTFKRCLGDAVADETRALTASLSGLAEDAIWVTHSILMDEDENAYVRLQASRVILQYRQKAIEHEELIDRIEALEDWLQD